MQLPNRKGFKTRDPVQKLTKQSVTFYRLTAWLKRYLTGNDTRDFLLLYGNAFVTLEAGSANERKISRVTFVCGKLWLISFLGRASRTYVCMRTRKIFPLTRQQRARSGQEEKAKIEIVAVESRWRKRRKKTRELNSLGVVAINDRYSRRTRQMRNRLLSLNEEKGPRTRFD